MIARLNADASRIHVQEFRAASDVSTLQAEGNIFLDSSPAVLALNARADSVSLAGLCSALAPDIPLDGIASAKAEISGPVTMPNAGAEIDVRKLQAYGETFGDLRSSIRLSGGRLELVSLSLGTSEGTPEWQNWLTASGDLDLKSGRFEVQSKAADLQLHRMTLPGGTPVRGSLNFDIRGSGLLSEPKLAGSFDVRHIQLGAAALGGLRGNVQLQGNRVEAELLAPDLNLVTSANVTLKPPYPAEVVAEAEGMILDRLGIHLAAGASLQGRITGRISASGSIEGWQEARGAAEIGELEVTLGKISIKNEGPLRLNLGDEILTVGDAVLLAGNSRLGVAGSIPLTASEIPGRLHLGGHIDLADAGGFLVPGRGVSLGGVLDLDLNLEGQRNALRVNGTGALRGGALRLPRLPQPITEAQAEMSIQNGAIRLDNMQGRLGDGTIRIQGELPLGLLGDQLPFGFEAAHGTARLTADLIDLPASAVAQLPAEVSGIISLHLDAETVKPELNAMKAELRLDKLDLAFNQLRLIQPAPSFISLENGLARIRQFALSGPGTELSAAGSLELAKSGNVDLKMQGHMNAALLTYFSSDLSGAGTIDIEIDVGRDLGNPQFSGYLESKDASLTTRSPRLQVSSLDFRIGLNDTRLSIDRLKGWLNGGSLEANGALSVAEGNITDVNITTAARGVFLDFPAGLHSILDADLAIQSQDDLIEIGGSARILEGAHKEPLDIQGEVLRYLRSDQTLNLEGQFNPFLSRIRYRMQIENRDPILVDNNLAKLAVNANLDLAGTYYRPVVTGRIILEEGGEVVLGERRYLVERGIIDLQNPLRIEPTLDLLVKTKVGSRDIDLLLTVLRID